jgi:hypothetical protein
LIENNSFDSDHYHQEDSQQEGSVLINQIDESHDRQQFNAHNESSSRQEYGYDEGEQNSNSQL